MLLRSKKTEVFKVEIIEVVLKVKNIQVPFQKEVKKLS